MDSTKQRVGSFKGLNNVTDSLRLSLAWATQADNVDVTWTNSITRCRGFTRRSTNFAISGAYATRDMKRLYVIDTGELRQMASDMSYIVLKSGLSSNKTWFEEVNGVVYYANGTDFGILEPAGWRPWGVPTPAAPPTVTMVAGSLPLGFYRVVCTLTDSRGMESGNCDEVVVKGSGAIQITNIPQQSGYTTNVYVTQHNGAVYMLLKARAGTSLTYSDENNLGLELPYWGTDGPRGSIVAFFDGKLYCAEALPQYDLTAIWSTLPLRFHHFNYAGDGLTVPGVVRMMKATKEALIIGTDRQIFAFDGEKLEELANYGVVPGWHASRSGDDLYFWSLRGLCSALPFKNVTEDTISVPPGSSAGAVVMEKNGMRRYVVALRKDSTPAYNGR